MASLQDLLNLINDDNSKAFIVGEDGEVKFVVLGVGEYQKLLLGKLKRTVEDVEEINRRIVEAQLAETDATPTTTRPQNPPRVDLRSEVIDADFRMGDYTSDAEAIKPGFDDI